MIKYVKQVIGISTIAIAFSSSSFGAELEPAPIPPQIKGEDVSMKRQAGIGSKVAYAEAGVVEVGGAINYSDTDSRTSAGVTPSIGYFFRDNFQISALTNYTYTHIEESDDLAQGEDATTSSGNIVLEPSAHFPMSRQNFIFGGLGVGAFFAESQDTGFALAPRVGIKTLVGRSGMLSLALQGVYALNEQDTNNDEETVITVEDGANVSFGYSVLL